MTFRLSPSRLAMSAGGLKWVMRVMAGVLAAGERYYPQG